MGPELVGPVVGWSARVERVRALSSPVIALLTSSLVLCCLVTVPDVAIGWPALSTANARLPGWAGAALVVAVATAMLCLAVCSRLGSAPSLALGTTAALLGLALAGDVASGAQVVLVLVVLALAVGALFASGLCLLEELTPELGRATLLGWVLPLAGGWGVVGWFAVHGRSSDETRLGLHPPALALVGGAALLLLWAVTTLALEPGRGPAADRAGWELPWTALAVVVATAGGLVTLIGFQPALAPSWGRPVVLLLAALVTVGLVLCGTAMPDPAARPACLAVVVSLGAGPACLQTLVLVSADGSGPLSGWVLVALAAAGLVGATAGWRRPRAGVVAGLVLLAASVAGGWVMPADQRLMLAAAAPLCLGTAVAVSSGIRLAAAGPLQLRFVAVAGLAGLLLGQLAAAPITWALGAGLTAHANARPGGRVLLGLTFALAVLAASVNAALPARPPPRSLRAEAERSAGVRSAAAEAGPSVDL